MKEKILITGGAGFIGSHTADALIEQGYHVRVLDNLDPQVHGPSRSLPPYLHQDVEFVHGDVRDRDTMVKALQDIRFVYHFAALTGVTQSMYQIHKYLDVNIMGTATLWDVIVNNGLDVANVIVASSRAVYGEGAYLCRHCMHKVYPLLRPVEQLETGQWEVTCPCCGREVEAIPTSEDKPLQPLSTYAQSKQAQEQTSQIVGTAHGIGHTVLRYFNVYGPRQALANPYTGVASVFCSRVLAGSPIVIYEDGLPVRDFVHVGDIVQANLLALKCVNAGGTVVNVGSGTKATILDIALAICTQMGIEPQLEFSREYRVGDIRSCYADIRSARKQLGYQPVIEFEEGISDLINWVTAQEKIADRYEESIRELEQRGVMRRIASGDEQAGRNST